jgi:hypothetical protein
MKEKSMLPLLPFAVGLLTGAAAVKLVKKDATRARLDQAQTQLRNATLSGLSALEQSSARLREKLAAPAVPPTPEAAPQPAPAQTTPRKRTSRRSTSAATTTTRSRKRAAAES